MEETRRQEEVGEGDFERHTQIGYLCRWIGYIHVLIEKVLVA